MITCPSCNAKHEYPGNFCARCGAALIPGQSKTATLDMASPARADTDVSRAGSSDKDGRFPPGTIVADRYRIVTIIGKGGMGEVYRADDLKLGHPVALKFLPVEFNADATRLELFHQEVRLARQISHPNVCRVYDIGVVDGQHFLSMEYVDGEDLQVLLRRIGRLPVDKVKEIAQQLCAGLVAAHEQGVLHRDLKPANILIDERGHVRITDFGLAKLVQDGLGDMSGTPAYMAPEQFLNGETTIQSDIYSLGLVLCEALTGERVLCGTREQIQRIHQSSAEHWPREALDQIAPELERVISRCLEKEPSARPRSVRVISAALPGGDPLSLAASMGITPTPDMVAAAGGTTGLSLRAASIWLITAIVGLGLVHIMAEQTYLVNRIDVWDRGKLEETAEERLDEFGYPVNAGDNVECGFAGDVNHHPLFWYRRRPANDPFVVNQLHEKSDAVSGMHGRVGLEIPGWGTPTEIGIVLTPDGRLKWFRAVPPSEFGAAPIKSQKTSGASTSNPLNGLGCVCIADLHVGHASGVSELPSSIRKGDLSIPVPPDPYDNLSIWQSEETGDQILLAAQYRGRLSFLERLSTPSETLSRWKSLFGAIRLHFWNVFLLLITFVSGGLFLWNYHLGRLDKRTTLRGSTYIFAVSMVIWLVSANHVNWAREYEVLRIGLAHAMLAAGFFAMWYVAVEPIVRKTWPECLVTWTRLARGQFSDPLVGRDVLAGVLAGIVCTLYFQFAIFVPDQLGVGAQPWPCWWWIPLNGKLDTLSEILRWQVTALFLCPCLLALLVLLRVVFRSQWVALLLLVAFLNVILFDPEFWLTNLVRYVLCWTTLIYLIFRFGLLSFVVGWYTLMLLQHFPITLHAGRVYSESSMLVVAVVILLALRGFYTTIGGRKRLVELRAQASSL